jgi:hypothetical protein
MPVACAEGSLFGAMINLTDTGKVIQNEFDHEMAGLGQADS